MKQAGRKIISIVLVVLIAYFLLGLVGVLPAQYDVIRRAQGTQVEYGTAIEYDVNPIYAHWDLEIDENYVWIIDNGGQICRMDKTNPETVNYYYSISENPNCEGITVDDNYVWFGEPIPNKIGRLNKNTGIVNEYTIPPFVESANPQRMSNDNNYVWVNFYGGIFRVDKSNPSTMNEFWLPEGEYAREGLTSDANYIWILTYSGKVARFDKSNPTNVNLYTIPTPNLNSILLTNDNQYVWFTTLGDDYTANKIGRLDKNNPETIVQYDGIPSGLPLPIAVDNNYVWFGDVINYKIGRLDKSNPTNIVQYSGLTSYPSEMEVDSYTGDVWSLEGESNKVWKLSVLAEVPATTGEFAFTQVGQWTEEGDGRAPFEYVGENIPITVEIDTNETIETASLLWQDVGESDWNFGDMVQGQDGAWRFSIPEQEREGTVYYQVKATTSEGAELFSDTYGVQVLTTAETPAPSEPLVNPTVFYGVGTLLLVAVGVAINMPSKKHN